MKNKLNDKLKNALLAIGLGVVAIVLVIGISMRLKPQEVKTPVATSQEEPNEAVNAGIDTLQSKPTETPAVIEVPETVPSSQISATKQQLQEDPVKTTEDKPKEKPDVSEEKASTGQTDSKASQDPKNNESSQKTEDRPTQEKPEDNNSSSPKDGEIKDGKIYFEGFGWVDYEGGGVEVKEGTEIYQNGNQIGIMD